MRNNKWLQKVASGLWQKYFSDIPPANDLRVKFGRKAKWQLGSIKQKRGLLRPSIIVINGHFKNSHVPKYVVEAILVHEFIHYITGFSSSKRQSSRFPHKGGIIKMEMKKRELEWLEKRQKEWVDKYWQKIIKSKH